jgi:hypothetical protein
MNAFPAVLALTTLLFQGCATTTPSSPPTAAADARPERDKAKREALLSAVAQLAGRWEVLDQEEPAFIEFAVSSGGSAVVETMFPGTPHEMTNMYTLDGNSLVMTHYCAAGNQPHMRASELRSGELAFTSFGVSDLASPNDSYMADMTITFIDDTRVNETWRGLAGGEESEMPVFKLQRVR